MSLYIIKIVEIFINVDGFRVNIKSIIFLYNNSQVFEIKSEEKNNTRIAT